MRARVKRRSCRVFLQGCGCPWRARWLCCALASALVLIACAQNPVTGKNELVLVSESEEIQIGSEGYVPGQQQSGGEYVIDQALTAYVREVGDKLARVSDRPDLPYEFVVLNESVPNAWAMPGGKIAINRGLLVELENEAELAAVLGHEIVHAAARHGAQSIERGYALQAGLLGVGLAVSDNEYSNMVVGAAALGANLINTKYGRDDESESDFYGMKYMAAVGYDPQAAVTLQEKFVALSGNPESGWVEGLFASHPPSQERVRANQQHLNQFPAGGFMGREEYQRRIAHLIETGPAYASYVKGREAMDDEQPERALAYARSALEGEPREALFYGLRGDAYLELGADGKALEAYDEAIARNDAYFKFYLHRGIVQRRLGNAGAARRDLERSNDLMPTAAAHYGLGELALAENQPNEAIRHFKMAANSKTELGQQAAVELARLDLPANPGSYIEAQAAGQSGGRVVVSIRNRSPVSVSNVQISVGLVYQGNRVVASDSLAPNGVIPPGGEHRVRSGMQVPNVDTSRLEFRSQVVRADVAD